MCVRSVLCVYVYVCVYYIVERKRKKKEKKKERNNHWKGKKWQTWQQYREIFERIYIRHRDAWHTYTRTRTRGSPSHWRMRVCERNRVSVHDSIPFISFLTCAPGDERARSTCARGLTYEWDDLNAEDRTPLFFERYKKKIGKNFLPCNPFAILFFFPSKKELLVSFELIQRAHAASAVQCTRIHVCTSITCTCI